MLGGISNHMDGSFDRKYFAGDRCYPDFAPNVYLQTSAVTKSDCNF